MSDLGSSRSVQHPPGDKLMARVLLVDDDPAVRRVLARIVSSFGHDVTAVQDGRSALDHAVQEPVDILVADLRMPGWDGVTTYKQIRKHLSNPPPAVLHTAAANGADLAAANGMTFIAKP